MDKVKVEYPLKQGLKPWNLWSYSARYSRVKVEYPLKQGLKHGYLATVTQQSLLVKVEYPLKQGLKRIDQGVFLYFVDC